MAAEDQVSYVLALLDTDAEIHNTQLQHPKALNSRDPAPPKTPISPKP